MPLRSTTSQVLRLLIGGHSSMRTMSPILHRFASSCAAYFFERRMNFLYSGCMTRRSTRTVTVLSILSLVTRPVSTRFGISRRSPYDFAAERVLLRHDGLHPRDLAPHLTHAADAFLLAGGTLEAQIELLLAQIQQHACCSSSGVFARTSVAFVFAITRLRCGR